MQVTKEIRFEAAHRLHLHAGACSNLHGHSYRLQVTIEGEVNANSDMVIDFGDLSAILGEVVNEGKWMGQDDVPWDHSTILEADDPLVKAISGLTGRVLLMPRKPTAELMVELLAESVQLALDQEGKYNCRVRRVRLWETEKSFAEWDVYDEEGK